jgi:coenzyme PQQ synthesis protein D (PqqD)
MSDRYIARSPRIAARKLGGEMIVMSAADSSLFTLNEVATAIWQSADGRTTLKNIVAHQVCAQFEVSEADAMRDAEEFVTQLAGHGILMVSNQPIETAQGGAQ